ncbi:MAG: hypothetical protein IID37_12260, partial [Planctomycetes bacterium]|nr:hypothetical protein [Planctomycetota bacterium]
ERMQIACYADFCNECGNCDTFCPEYGGPYIQKPSFFGTIESWTRAAPRDGFVVEAHAAGDRIQGRIRGAIFQLYIMHDRTNLFVDNVIAAVLEAERHELISVKRLEKLSADYRIDMGVYHTLRYLLGGVSDQSCVNQVNARTFAVGVTT